MRIKGKVTTDESAVTVHYLPSISYVIECFRVLSGSVATLKTPDGERGRRTDEQSCQSITSETENGV